LETLPDYLRPGLRVLSIGLNPSPASMRAGFYFANPRNRFWLACAAAGLTPPGLSPGIEAVERLFRDSGLGFTDVVKRPTAGVAGLRAADFVRDAPVLAAKLRELGPAVAWFHGKVAYERYLRHAEGRVERCDWGWQASPIGDSRVFVTPNPSPANAAFSLDVLARWYALLAGELGIRG
jgi:TDG/mug DNA glycosylase family protein